MLKKKVSLDIDTEENASWEIISSNKSAPLIPWNDHVGTNYLC